MVVTAEAERCTGGLLVSIQRVVVFHLPQTTLQLHKNIKYEGLHLHFKLFTLLDWFYDFLKTIDRRSKF